MAQRGDEMGGDLREQLLHRGDGVPCVGVRAACSPRWLDSKHLISIFALSMGMWGQRRRTATHPSGWTCRAGKRWAGLAWAGLPFRWIDWGRVVKGGERERSRWRWI